MIIFVAAIVALVFTFIGAVIQGSVGFGLGLVVVPVIALIDPDLVPAVPILLALPVAGFVAWRQRTDVAFGEIGWAWLGRIPGTFVGAWLLNSLSGDALEAVFAALILVAVAVAAGRRSSRTGAPIMVAAGFASGTMATAVSTGGPPMVLVMLDMPPQRLRATLNAFFFVGALVSLGALVIIGRTSWHQIAVSAALLPAVGAGLVVAQRWGSRLPPDTVRSGALALSAVAALVLLVSAVL